MSDLQLTERDDYNAPTFTLGNRIKRTLWRLVWVLVASWTPPPLHFWRIMLLNVFGAQVARSARVYGSVEVWAPWNLEVAEFGTLGPRVRCYNIARISIGYKVVVSQGAYLCTGTHNYLDPEFPLTARPITVGERAWVCAETFVGPGVNIGAGAVLGAASVANRDLDAWTVYSGNPAEARRKRPVMTDAKPS